MTTVVAHRQRSEVLIVGGSLVGLSAAASLAEADVVQQDAASSAE